MAVKTGRRKVRKRKNNNEKYGMKLKVFVGIILVAVFLGFLTAKFVIGPVIGYNADESPISTADDTADAEKEDNQQQEPDEDASSQVGYESGYALQFGAFSSRESAQELSDMLHEKGIKTQVVEIDDVFKVMGEASGSKDDVLQELSQIREKDVEDVFVASLG